MASPPVLRPFAQRHAAEPGHGKRCLLLPASLESIQSALSRSPSPPFQLPVRLDASDGCFRSSYHPMLRSCAVTFTRCSDSVDRSCPDTTLMGILAAPILFRDGPAFHPVRKARI